MNEENNWWIYKGTHNAHDGIKRLPEPPNWRKFKRIEDKTLIDLPSFDEQDLWEMERHIGAGFEAGEQEIKLVNAALYLRRPLLITGKPGSGKSSLAYAVAHELNLGRVLRWPITTQSTLTDGLYRYDALGRLEDASEASRKYSGTTNTQLEVSLQDIGQYLRLGPLGTAFLPWKYPRVLLIDEIDKGSIDLPNDLLNIFEEGEFEIPKLVRLSQRKKLAADGTDDKDEDESKPERVLPYDGRVEKDRVPIKNGRVQCSTFPFVVLTSNGERVFPPAFLRRCLRLEMALPKDEKLKKIVEAHFKTYLETHPENSNILEDEQVKQLIKVFLELQQKDGNVATDQLLNAIYMTASGVRMKVDEKLFRESLLQSLTNK